MSLRRTIKRRIEFRDAVIETHFGTGTQHAGSMTKLLSGNTFSGARRRMKQGRVKKASKK